MVAIHGDSARLRRLESGYYMTDATKSSQDQSPVKLAVFETVGSEKTHIATISITEDGQGNWQVKLNGTSDSDVARVQAVFDRFAADQKAQATPQAQRAIGSVPALTETLKESGFIVEQLPDATIRSTSRST
jgi:hypothetical protein